MIDTETAIERLNDISCYFKSMMQCGYQGDFDIYRKHRESIKMAIKLLNFYKEHEHEVCANCPIQEQDELEGIKLENSRLFSENIRLNKLIYELKIDYKKVQEQIAMMKFICGDQGKVVGELVRCKDCKHWVGGGIDDKDNFIPPRCNNLNRIALHDWFCADGERK